MINKCYTVLYCYINIILPRLFIILFYYSVECSPKCDEYTVKHFLYKL